jgi:hypothetical protein
MTERSPLQLPPDVPEERRRHRRIQVLIAVEVEAGGYPQVARVTELSREGARLQMARPPAAGTRLTIRRADVNLTAITMWCRGTSAGIHFVQPLNELAFLKLRRRA